MLKIGGSFAPPLTDANLSLYRSMVQALPAHSQIRDAMGKLLTCCEAWWALPDSAGTPTQPHPSGRGTIVTLDTAHQATLFDLIPWREELDLMARLFDGIDPVAAKPLRDAAHHLLWVAVELCLDREPMTADKL